MTPTIAAPARPAAASAAPAAIVDADARLVTPGADEDVVPPTSSQADGMQQVVPFEIPRLRQLAGHALPNIAEASLVPLALFYAAMWALGPWGGLAAALAWSYLAIGRRVLRGERIPGILLLGTAALTARTVIAMASGSIFIYFLQPTLGTLAVAGAFLLSVPAGRPLAAKLAADFCPLPEAFAGHPRVRQFFARISLLWAMVYITNAALTFWLLVSQSLGVFLIVKSVASWALTGSAIAISTVWFRRSMRRHGLLATRSEAVAAPAAA